MLKYASLIVPLLLRGGTSNPVKVMTGYMGAFLLAVIAGLFFLATVFTWVATQYSLDVAFLSVALILAAGSAGLWVMARVTKNADMKKIAEREADLKGYSAAKRDPLSDHIPEELLAHPLSQRVFAQIDNNPWAASAAAIGFGYLISRQLIDAD